MDLNHNKTVCNKLTNLDNQYNNDKDIKNILLALQKLIPEFFSYDGEARGIRKIYDELHTDKYDDVRIESLDLNISRDRYEDYYNGMIKFIDDFYNSDIKKDLAPKIDIAIENDPKFINEIFGGKLNPKSSDFTLKDATINFEVLIQFMGNLRTFISDVDRFASYTPLENEEEAEMMKKIFTLYHDSIERYCVNLIRGVFDTYIKVMDEINRSSESPVEEKKYQLF